jgi:glycosyltransferase involved in cell wall biosynthesis
MKEMVSVVIPTWNRRDDLKEALVSINNQTHKPSEIIIVDNRSTDGTIEMLRRDFPDVKLVVMPESSYGNCESINVGFSTAQYEYIAILDDDITIPGDWTENLIKRFRQEPDSTGAITTKIIEPGMPEEMKRESPEQYMISFWGCGTLIRRDVLDLAGYYPKKHIVFVAECDVGVRMAALGYRTLQYDKVKTYHKRRFGLRGGKRSFFYHARNNHWFMWKYYPARDILVQGTLFTLGYFLKARRERQLKAFFKGTLASLLGVPYCLKNRKVYHDFEFKQYSMRNFKGLLKTLKSGGRM